MKKEKDVVKKQLDKLGYFKYVDAKNLESVVEKTFENYKGEGKINFPWDSLNRTFSIDARAIFKSDGILEQIESMLEIFHALGIDLEIGEYVEEFDEVKEIYTKRSIELNEKIYSLAGVSDWGTAFNSGFKLIDFLLKEYGKTERVFGLFLDETSTLIILDDPLFSYLRRLIPDGSKYRPVDLRKMMLEHFRG